MWLRRVVVVGLLYFLSLGANLSANQSARAEWKSSANVDVTAEGLYWASGILRPDKNRARALGTVKVPMGLRNGRTLRFRLLPIFQSDHLSPSKNERYFWDIQEGYMQLQFLPWTIQLGQNVQTWGDTDVFNPLDVVNARRYFDPFRSEKLGAPTLLVKREWESFFFEAIYIPRQRETLLPGEESRWLPRDVYRSRRFEGVDIGGGQTLSGNINLPSDMRYHYNKPSVLSAVLNDNFGARMKFRFSGFDWTIAGFQGAATTPSVNLDNPTTFSIYVRPGATSVDLNVQPDIFLKALYYKTRMVGTSFVWVLGDFLVKGASAHTAILSNAEDGLLPKETWENALGLERTFGLGSGSLTALAQGTYVKRPEKLDTNSVSLTRMFDRAAMAGLRWAPNERLTVLASVLYDIHYKGHLEHAEIGYKLKDGLLGKLGADMLDGKAETPLGTYRRNDRVFISLNLQK